LAIQSVYNPTTEFCEFSAPGDYDLADPTHNWNLFINGTESELGMDS